MRDAMIAQGIAFDSESERRAEEALLFAFALTRASRRVRLSRPRLDLAGREQEPSPYLDDVARAAGVSAGLIEEYAPKSFAHPLWPSDRMAPSWGDLTREGAFRAGRFHRVGAAVDPRDSAWHVVFHDALAPRLFARAGRELIAGAEAKPVSGDALKVLRARFQVLHPTALADFIDCPFRHLVRHALEPAEPLEPPSLDDPLVRGTMVHRFLCDHLLGGTSQESWIKRGLVDILKKEVPAIDASNPLVNLQLERLADHLAVFLGRENDILAAGAFHPQPGDLELRLSPRLAPGASETPRTFRMRLDRVDTEASGAGFIVIDYKTGSTSIDLPKKSLSPEKAARRPPTRRLSAGRTAAARVRAVRRDVSQPVASPRERFYRGRNPRGPRHRPAHRLEHVPRGGNRKRSRCL
ncbi:MAG: PD-(D/E)XK nuclease family protein [Deltaproteobacteria bacterium]|nr:PD-(D/E)XK nuclease family protein [Deltaproteobacteria bacterium]